jgi:hypothetical protein
MIEMSTSHGQRKGSVIMARKRRATPEDIAQFYEKLRTGTPEEKLNATAKYYGRPANTIRNQLRFWWPGSKFLKEFGNGEGSNRRRWEMPTDQLLKALNKHRSIVKTATALKTTPITLSKALERKNIVQEWVVRKT